MKHWGKALFGVAVTVLLLWWVLRGEDPAEILAAIRGGDMRLLAASVFVATFGFVIRAMRWRVLLAPVQPDTSFRSRFAAVSIGFMANNVLPARAGEFARPYALSRMEPVSMSAAFGSLVVERFMDGVMLLLFLVIPVLTPGFPATDALTSGMGGAVLKAGVVTVLVVMLVLVAMAVAPAGFVAAGEAVARVLPTALGRRAVDALHAFLDSIAIMRDPRLLLSGFAWTALFWTWHGLSFWLGMLAFGIDTGFVSAIFTEAVVGFGVALPSAPGFVGTFHASAVFALETVYGQPSDDVLAFAFGYHFGGWVPITAIGLYYAWKLGLSLGEMEAAEEVVEEAVEARHPHADGR